VQILTIRLGAVGDVLMALPAIAALGRVFPTAQIDHLVEQGAAGAISGTPGLRETVIAPRKKLTMAELLKTRRRLRDTGYDLVIDFHNLLRSGIWAAQVPAPKKVVRRNWRELSPVFFDTHVPYDERQNVVRQHMALVEALAHGPVSLECVRPPVDEAVADAALKALGIVAPFVAIAPGSRWPGRAVPDRLVRDTVAACHARSLVPLLIGGPREAAQFAVLAKELGVAANTDLSLRGLAGVIARASLVVSADSAPLHYADLLQRPVIGIFGPSSPRLYGPVFAPNVCLRDPALGDLTSTVRTKDASATFDAITRVEIDRAFDQLGRS
jgi:heptosyltransferase-1